MVGAVPFCFVCLLLVESYLLNFEATIVVLLIISEDEPLPAIPEVFLPHTVTLPSLLRTALNQEPAAPLLAELLMSSGKEKAEAEMGFVPFELEE